MQRDPNRQSLFHSFDHNGRDGIVSSANRETDHLGELVVFWC